MKRFIASLFAALLAAQAWAQDFTIDNLSYYITDADNHYVSVCRGPEWPTGNLIIPSTVSNGGINYTVTGIRAWAFNGCSGLTSVTIPESITSINHYAFSECSGLTSITIPKSVTSIGCTMVMDCNNLTEIIVDSENENYSSSEDGVLFNKDKTTLICCPAAKTGEYSIPEGVTTIGDYAFWGCAGLTSVIIPETVKSLGTAIFHACTSLTSVHIPKSVTSIAFNTFMGCNNLTTIYVDSGNENYSAENGVLFNKDKTTLFCYPAGKSGAYTISESVSRINDASFYGCRNLTSVTIPNSITAISYVAFHGCSGLTAITIPETVTVIERGAFEECTGLTSVNIPENVTEIGYEAFANCTGLTSVTIPETVTKIGYGAFYDCKSLNSLTIPENVTEIGNNAFYGVRHIVYSGNVEGAPWGAYYVNGSVEGNFVYADEQHKTLNAYIGSGGSVTIPSTVETISDNAFSGCSSITSINIPGSVTSVISGAMFSTCNSLTAINVDSENTTYSSDGGVLFNKDKTTLVRYPIGKTGAYTIPETVTTISEYAFYGCSGLTAITIPSTVTSIIYNAFYNCDNLKTLTYNTNALGSHFAGNTSLETVNIGESVTYISSSAFENCTSLKSITIPNTITSIGYRAFQNCTSLTSIDIPNSVQNISEYAFQNCTGLSSITFPNTLTRINEGAFEGCTSLTIKNIPESVKWIAPGAFTGCTIGDNSPYNRWLSAGNMWETDNSGVAYTYVYGGSEESAYRFYNLFHETSGQATGAKFKLTFDIKWKRSWDNETDNAIVHLLTGAMVNGDEHTDWQNNADENTELVFENGFSAGQNKRFVLINSEWTTIEWGGTIGAKGADWLGVQLNLGDADGNNHGYFYIKNLKVQMGDNLTEYFKIDESNAFGYELNDDGGATVTNCYLDGDVKEITIPATATIDGKEYAVTRIGDYLFSERSKMTSVSLPESVTTIGYYAFNNCTSLASITIPESVTTIEYNAFNNCASLTSINIPQAVSSIGGEAFCGCSKLAAIYVDGGNENFSSAGGVLFNNAKTELICYPAGKSGAYTIPSTVTSIGSAAFGNCMGLTSITIPNSVNYISNYAFQGCTGLTSIDIPKSVSSVDVYSFWECSNLAAINVDDENADYSSVDGVLFNKDQSRLICYPEGKTGGYSIPNTVATIREDAFRNCSELSSVEIPNSVTYIGSEAFAYCTSLTSVTIPESVTKISDYTFYGCSNLASINIPTSVTNIGNAVFYGCDNLSFNEYGNALYLESNGNPYYCLVSVKSNDIETCTINSNCELIKLSAFRDCYRLQFNENDNAYYLPSDDNDFYLLVKAKSTDIASCTIHSDCKYIGSSAFYNCNSMESIEIPSSVKSIGDNAFSLCYNIKTLTYNTDAFNSRSIDRSKLEAVNIGDAVTTIPDNAFAGCYNLKSVTIGESVESIGEFAFQACHSLTSIVIPESVKNIGKYAFNNCDGLTSIVIPESVKTVGDYAFAYCDNLSEVTYNPATTTISENAFEGTKVNLQQGNEEEEVLTYEVRDGVAVVTGYKTNIPENLTIPSTVTIDGVEYDVKGIANNAFNNCENLKSVTIGNSVESIGENAFNGCSHLESITIESDANFSNAGLYFKQDGIKYHVLNKDEVEIVAEFYEEHEDGSVSYNQNILSGDLVIPESITIGQNYTVKNIGPYAFGGAITSVTIPNSVTNIGANAFSSCIDLKSATIGNSVETIGNSAFNGCKNLETVNMGNSVKNIGNDAFRATSIKDINIPSSVTNIGEWAFAECLNLETIDIPSSVETVGDYAFWYCDNLSELTYNPATTTIGENAFAGTKVNLQQGNEEEEYVLRYEIRDGAVIVSGYNSNIPENLTIPSTVTIDGVEYAVTGIRENAFYGCDKLKSIEISEGIETIGDKAFLGCSNLESITIPSSVSSFGGWDVFEGCEKVKTLTYNTDALDLRYVNKLPLETVVIGESVTKIQSSGFYDCSSLKSVTIGNSVETIGGYAFNNCTGLTSIEIPESVKEIGKNAFSNCTGLTSVEIPKTVKTVGDYAFANCSNLANVDYNPSTTTFGKGAFEGTEIESQQGTEEEGYELTYVIRDGAAVVTGYNGTISGDVTIPLTLTINGTNYTVKGIDDNAFNNCTKLTSVTIPNSVESIGSKAFNNCTKLTSVTIPNSVESIGSKAFYNCTGLGSLTVPKSVTSIGTDAFKDVNNVVNMSKIPDGQWGAASIFTLRHDTVRMQITETKIEYIHDTIFMFRTVAVNDLSANLSIYPNPTTSFVTVKGERKFSYVLANSTGAALRRGDGSDMYVIDLSDYADGIYLLYTSDGELYKIIKE